MFWTPQNLIVFRNSLEIPFVLNLDIEKVKVCFFYLLQVVYSQELKTICFHSKPFHQHKTQ